MQAALLLLSLSPASAALHLAHVIRTHPEVAPAAFESARLYLAIGPSEVFVREFQLHLESIWKTIPPYAERVAAETGMHRLTLVALHSGVQSRARSSPRTWWPEQWRRE